MTKKLNQYGDYLVPANKHGHGSEISSFRRDDLDKNALLFVQDFLDSTPVVFDLGTGFGSMALEFSKLGANVYAFDIATMRPLHEESKRGKFPFSNIVQGDIRIVDWSLYPAPDVVFSQRTLHYLKYTEVVDVLSRILRDREKIKLFLSFSGMSSELSEGYPKLDIKMRFEFLSEEMRIKHDIKNRVCLYSTDDVVRLAKDLSLKVEDVWASAFGNVKAILSK
jgi:SAM-dependent methyltransferase